MGKTSSLKTKQIADLHRSKQTQIHRHTLEDIETMQENTKKIYTLAKATLENIAMKGKYLSHSWSETLIEGLPKFSQQFFLGEQILQN